MHCILNQKNSTFVCSMHFSRGGSPEFHGVPPLHSPDFHEVIKGSTGYQGFRRVSKLHKISQKILVPTLSCHKLQLSIMETLTFCSENWNVVHVRKLATVAIFTDCKPGWTSPGDDNCFKYFGGYNFKVFP